MDDEEQIYGNLRIPQWEERIRVSEQYQTTKKAPLVTIRCITYNHVNFIEECITGFLRQSVNFPVEIIIHDDASSDGTQDIIRRYASLYPNIIRGILQEENQYSKGKKPSSFINPLCRGLFVAFCEGDDSWNSDDKLQLQVGALMNRPDIDICFHPAERVDLNDETNKKIVGRYRTTNDIIPVSEFITKSKGQIPTASLMVRRHVLREADKFREAHPYLTVGDVYVGILGALRGGGIYIDKSMSVYRIGVPGSWTVRYGNSGQLRLRHVSARIKSFNALNEMTYFKYNSYFNKANKEWTNDFIWDRDIRAPMKIKFVLLNWAALGWRDRIRGLAYGFFPWLLRF